jgi:septum formation protein
METLLLASSSPRRKELLAMLGIPFATVHPEIDESVCDHLPPRERVVALAQKKADKGRHLFLSSNRLGLEKLPRFILAADTLVAFPAPAGWEVIGKPESETQARTMLRRIQGKTQEVHTGICVENLETGERRTALSYSLVRFSQMREDEIDRYLALGEWEGAAGAYRIQGWGACYIEAIEGSHSGIMGLPLRELYGILEEAGYSFGA